VRPALFFLDCEAYTCFAESLVSGPLSSTCATMAKVATSPKTDMPNYQHVMCLYMPDVYDKDAVTEVFLAVYFSILLHSDFHPKGHEGTTEKPWHESHWSQV
jgi:hypothetical protein